MKKSRESLRKPLGYVGVRSLSKHELRRVQEDQPLQRVEGLLVQFHLFMYCKHVLAFVSRFCCFPVLQKLYEYNYDGVICHMPPFPFSLLPPFPALTSLIHTSIFTFLSLSLSSLFILSLTTQTPPLLLFYAISLFHFSSQITLTIHTLYNQHILLFLHYVYSLTSLTISMFFQFFRILFFS